MKIKIIAAIVTVIFISGCVQNKNIYYWGNYSNTLYDVKKENTDDADNKHYLELIKIVQSAAGYKKRIPPGIYFELSMYEAKRGNTAKSQEYLNREITLFPEAMKYVNQVKVASNNE